MYSSNNAFSTQEIREKFPILSREIHGRPLVYLDNAATTHKPQQVLDAIAAYYSQHNANVHRGLHTLSDESTQIWSDSRRTIADFFGAEPSQFIATRNTTEALNTLVYGWGEQHISAGDVIAVGLAEHHSHFVPWQQLAHRKQAEFLVLPSGEDGVLDPEQVSAFLHPYRERLKVVALTHISNVLGVVDPLFIGSFLRDWGIREQVWVSLDAAQSAARLPLNISTMDVDSLAFSGHKLYGPMGIGGLIVAKGRLAELQPILLGGGMIGEVSVSQTSFAEDLEDRFTAGTPDVASLAGLAAAIKFVEESGIRQIQQHEEELTQYALQRLAELPQLQIVGPTQTRNAAGELVRLGSVAWLYEGVHAHDVAQILDRSGVAVRSGHHCAMPLHSLREWPATTRASFAVYNTKEEIDVLIEALREVKTVFGK
jgi:cysteine desulfurase/selenocysteine lyase